MRLGGSMRRRRPGRSGGQGATPRPGKGAGSGRGKKRSPASPRTTRLVLLVAGAVLVGSGTGYVYATQVVFPAAEEEVIDVREVPDLRSLPVAEAETFVRDRGLEIGRVEAVHHPDVPEGWVIGQSPFPGQLAAAERGIELTVSLGPERRVVPDVTRLRADRALTVLQSSGFMVAVDSIEAEVPAGQIVATYPEGGTELPLPSEVRLAVSLGPPLVPMPWLAGLQEERARAVIDSLGLVVGEVETRFRFGFNQGEVLEHFPVADSLIPAGTEVRLVIGRRGFFLDP